MTRGRGWRGERVTRRRATLTVLPVLLSCAAACGAPRVSLPTGGGTPFPAFGDAYAQATAECQTIKTLTASLSLSGRAGKTKIAARIDAGFTEPDRLRLEGFPRIHFGGRPFFVLVSRGGAATLVLVRDGRVLRGAPPAAIVEALAGVALEPAELRAVVAGCGLGSTAPATGESFPKGWAAGTAGGTQIFLRQIDARWRVAAVRRGSLTIEYADHGGGRAATVRLRTAPASGGSPADLVLRLSQVEINVPLGDAVFEAQVPPDATPMTLEELRRAGPLGGAAGSDDEERAR